jgi:hypothetical protein
VNRADSLRIAGALLASWAPIGVVPFPDDIPPDPPPAAQEPACEQLSLGFAPTLARELVCPGPTIAKRLEAAAKGTEVPNGA